MRFPETKRHKQIRYVNYAREKKKMTMTFYGKGQIELVFLLEFLKIKSGLNLWLILNTWIFK